MYAVIFRAQIKTQDDEYLVTALRMRDLAISDYGCKEFLFFTEGDTEIAISYWDSEEQIQQWKKNSEHLVAQELGRTKWYRSYKVQVVEIKREYSSGT